MRIWFSTGSLTITGLYLLAELALCHPRLRAAARLLPAAGLAIDVIWFESPWTWTDAVDALVQVAELVIPQLVTARLIEPELVVCPTCLGTGRDPEAPAAIADDGACPRHPLYAAHHGHVLQEATGSMTKPTTAAPSPTSSTPRAGAKGAAMMLVEFGR